MSIPEGVRLILLLVVFLLLGGALVRSFLRHRRSHPTRGEFPAGRKFFPIFLAAGVIGLAALVVIGQRMAIVSSEFNQRFQLYHYGYQRCDGCGLTTIRAAAPVTLYAGPEGLALAGTFRIRRIPLHEMERVTWDGAFDQPIGLPAPRLGISLPRPILVLKGGGSYYFSFFSARDFENFIHFVDATGIPIDKRLLPAVPPAPPENE